MSGSGIDLFLGDLTISAIPLEMSLNYCSTNCAFCFANLSSPNRTADVEGILRAIKTRGTRKALDAALMSAGCPVLVSNRVDPFASSNVKASLPIFELMTEVGVPYAIQTRGGKGVDEFLSFAKPSVWYVSICSLDEVYTKRVEPGAWMPERRFDMIRKVKEVGHRVVLGLNPLVPEWCPDPGPLLEKAKAAGCEGVWIDPLHLSPRQVNGGIREGKPVGGMSEKAKQAISLPVIDRVVKRQQHREDIAAYLEARKVALSMGLHVYSVGQSERSDFWEPFKAVYGAEVLFPTMQEFVNACHDHLPDGTVIPFAEFWRFFAPHLPSGQWSETSRYIRAKAHDILEENRVSGSLSYRDIFAMIWAEPRIAWCPTRMQCFAYAGRRLNEKKWVMYVDENDLPYVVFSREPFEGYLTEADGFTELEPIAGEVPVDFAASA